MAKISKETKKYYLSTFIMSAVFMIAMVIIAHAQGSYLFSGSASASGSTFTLYGKEFNVGQYVLDLIIVVLFPFVFTGIFALIEFLSKKVRSKKKKQAEEDERNYSEFVNTMSAQLNATHKYNVEDFRHFRENKKFQEVLKRLFLIYSNGETEENSYMLCLRKFDKGTKERESVEYLVTFTKKAADLKNKKDE